MTWRWTTPLLLLALVAGACNPPGTPQPAATGTPSPGPTVAVNPATPTPAPTPSPTPAPMFWPLTGQPLDDPAKAKRRPLNVRFPNDVSARPQVGLAKADIVFEMIVEGGITRHSGIYHSQDVQEVGPVRSYRLSDLYITEMLRGAIVASGATIEEIEAVSKAIREGKLISVDAQRVSGFYYRVAGRPGPNNLFVDLIKAREAVNNAGGADPVDVPPLAFLPPDNADPMAGGFGTSQPASRVVIPFRNPTTFTWDEAAKVYRRAQGGVQTVDPDGNVPIGAKNVVVIWTDITETNIIQDRFGSRGLDYRMTGGGKASVFRDGRRVDGTWKRDAALDMFTFHDQAGAEILLAPGQSWFHFVYPDWVVTSEP